MSDQTKSLNMLVYVNIKESCRGRIKLHKLSWSRYRFSTFVSLVHKTLYLTGQGYSLLGNLARLSTSVSTRKSLVSGQLSTNPLIKVSIHRPLLNVSFRTHFNGEILRHFSTTLDNRAKLMLVIPTKLSLCTRSMKKVTEKVAKEVAKASSEESSNLVPKVAPSAGLHSPNTSLGSSSKVNPLPNVQDLSSNTETKSNVSEKHPLQDRHDKAQKVFDNTSKDSQSGDSSDTVSSSSISEHQQETRIAKATSSLNINDSLNTVPAPSPISTHQSQPLNVQAFQDVTEVTNANDLPKASDQVFTIGNTSYTIDTDGSIMEVVREPNVDPELNFAPFMPSNPGNNNPQSEQATKPSLYHVSTYTTTTLSEPDYVDGSSNSTIDTEQSKTSTQTNTGSSLLGKFWGYLSGNSFTSTTSSTQVPITPLLDSSNPVAPSLQEDNLTITTYSKPVNSGDTSSFSSEEPSAETKENTTLINDAIQHGILKYEDTSEYPKSGALKLTPEGYKLYTEIHPKPLILSDESVSSSEVFEVGVLTINNETLVTLASQEHLVVAHDYNTNTMKVVGILTSNKKDTTTLSKDQPISGNDHKEQCFQPYSIPLKVKPEDFKKHEKGTEYIQQPDITKTVKQIVKDKVIMKPVNYNSKGGTNEDITKMLELKKQSIESSKALEAAKASKPTNFLDKDKETKALIKK